MSYLESPKSRFTSIASVLAAGASAQGSHRPRPGCVQCGRLLEAPERRKRNFSGKCYSCEHWGFDDEYFDEPEG